MTGDESLVNDPNFEVRQDFNLLGLTSHCNVNVATDCLLLQLLTGVI